MERHRRTGDGSSVPLVVSVCLLGEFRVLIGDDLVEEGDWGLKKARSLVQILSLTPEHRLHREQVMDLLWPDFPLAAAANNLHQTLYTARKTLGGSGFLPLRGEYVTLCPGAELRVDVEEFEAAAKVARRERSIPEYRAATDLYTGDLLPRNLYDDWAEVRRTRLRETCLDLLIRLSALYEEHGQFASALETLRRASEIEPERQEVALSLNRLREFAAREPGGEASEQTTGVRGGTLDNLPVTLTSFVGREREMSEVGAMLAANRLLTLTGAGGAGKTRLALEVSGGLAASYPHGVWLVELAPLSDGSLLWQEICRVLDVREKPDRSPSDDLMEALRFRELLLVLDNCEHLVGDVAHLVEKLLVSCPGLGVLATSRETLGVPGEVRYPVPPLALPDPDLPVVVEEIQSAEAARLFVERASRRGSGFEMTQENARTVAQICRRLDGIPLAIELAAARVGTLSVEHISERLTDSLSLLAGGVRTATPRQKTLRGALDWGHELLEEPERMLFGRLSSFTGGWTLEAAEVVGGGDGIGRSDVLGLLSGLVEKSLVVVVEYGSPSPRYRMLEPIRQYAREKLGESGESGTVLGRHAKHFLTVAEEAEPELVGRDQSLWLSRLDAEYDNIRAALGWSFADGKFETGVRLAGSLGEFWELRGLLVEGRGWLETAIGQESPATVRAKVLFWGGNFAREQGDYERAEALGEENLGIMRELEDGAALAALLYDLGLLALYQDEYETSRSRLEEALALQRESGNEVGASLALQALGSGALVRGDYDLAAGYNEEALTLARKTADPIAMIFGLGLGALAAAGRGDHSEAKILRDEGFALALQFGHERLVIHYLHICAVISGAEGHLVRAARLWGATEALRENIGAALSPVESRYFEPYVRAVHETLDETTRGAAWDEGRTMTRKEATDYALSEETSTGEESGGRVLVSLSPREREVAGLISCGFTNREISETLDISGRTAEAHTAAILRKLGLSSRHQVAEWMRDHPRSETHQS